MEVHFPHLTNGITQTKPRVKRNYLTKMFVLAVCFAASLIVYVSSSNAGFVGFELAESVIASGEVLHVDVGTDELGERMYLYLIRYDENIYHCASYPYNNALLFECIDSR